jgi:hypothetical protein
MMMPILRKKTASKNAPIIIKSLSAKYEELARVAKSLGINHDEALASQGLAIPELTQKTGKKRKAVDIEPEQYIAALHCNRTTPQGVKFRPNLVIKEPEYGIFFVDEFGQEAFQRVSDIDKVETTTLLAYKLMALNIRRPENEEFVRLMDQMMKDRPDKEVLMSKKAKLELMGLAQEP